MEIECKTLSFVRNPENLFSKETITAIEETISKIRGLKIKGKNEESQLANKLFDELSKDDIGKDLLKIYEFGKKPKKDDLFTLIYLKDLAASIENAIVEADNDSLLVLIKKLVYDYFDNYFEGEIGEESSGDSIDEQISKLKSEFSTLEEKNNYGLDYTDRRVLMLFVKRSQDLTFLDIQLQIGIIVRLCLDGKNFTPIDFPFESVFSQKAIEEVREIYADYKNTLKGKINFM